MNKDIQPIQIDVICDCSDCYDAPIFDNHQASIIQRSGLFTIGVQAVSHTDRKKAISGIPLDDHKALRQSSSTVLFCVDIDQHDKGISLQAYPEVFKKYKELVYIVSEPIFGEAAYPNAKKSHLQFLNDCEKLTGKLPIVLYSSKIDCALSPVPDTLYWTNLVDSYYDGKLQTDKKRQGVLAGSFSTMTSLQDKWPQRWESVKTIFTECAMLLDLELKVSSLNSPKPDSYSQLCEKVASSMIQFQPSHSFYFHNLRFLQSWFVGTIPIVVNANNWLDDLYVKRYYADWLNQHMKTCVLTDVNNFYADMTSLLSPNDDKVLEMLENISKLDLTTYTTSAMIQNIYNKLSKAL